MSATPRVSQSEGELLALAAAIVSGEGLGSVDPLLGKRRELPPRLSPPALDVLESTLSRGAVLALAKRGGWRPERHLLGDAAKGGRLWDRHAPLALSFSRDSIELLRWLQGGGSGKFRDFSQPGDALFAFLALDLFCGAAIGESLATLPAIRRIPLAWLAFPDLLSASGPMTLADAAWGPLCTGPFAVIVEALQQDLARRWLAVERQKFGQLGREELSVIGEGQEAALTAFLCAANGAGRRDLAFFMLDAGATLLRKGPPASTWISGMEGGGTVAERARARRGAAAFLRALGRWRSWDEEHRGVRFVDDGYDAAQLLLARYERYGPQSATHADGICRALDSLEAVTQEIHP